ncbi:hypothetical protein [Microbacterium hydrocarbonoxydans]|uniref:hypothetical protein n=1 Tax=Microbacterium hydrocarbonoxydans TaxID=273678 RepID=UPI00203EB6C3|nr:hypothetical protein [Microbacterium hydrocarbonoxydans]MCM3778990.1 hypothetical protein [Microbacterium hydrocarbonoxydans]
MAVKDINIPITGDAREFIRETRNVENALDDVADSLDDMTRDTKQGADKAERAVEGLEDKFREAVRRAKDVGDAGKDAGDDVRRGMDRAEEGVSEFKDEAQQTAREAAASFDGSFESIGEVAQEVAANAFSGFGPAGTAAGIAVAAGAGVMIDAITKASEAFDEAKESAFEMAYSVGGALQTAGVQARMSEWSNDTEKWKQITDLAVASGWDEIDVLTALAKGGDDLDRLSSAFADHGMQTMLTNGRLTELDGVLRGVKDGYMSGAQAAEVSARALYDYAAQAGEATGKTDALGNSIVLLPDNTEVVVNAQTGKASTDVNAFDSKVRNLPDGSVAVNVDTSGAERAMSDFVGRRRTATVYARVVGETFGKGVY